MTEREQRIWDAAFASVIAQDHMKNSTFIPDALVKQAAGAGYRAVRLFRHAQNSNVNMGINLLPIY